MQSAEFNTCKQQLSREIAFLLKAHDCVIVPDFGGFIGNYSPARVHPVTYVFQPPHKQLAFNRNLKNDDGLLINRLTLSLNISFTEARQWMVNFAEALNNRVFAGERVELEEVGRLFTDVERNIQFQSSNAENHLLHSYGLFSVQAHAINRFPVPERRPEPVFLNRELVPPAVPARKLWKRVLQLSPIAAVALLIALNSALPADKGVSYADLNPFSNHTPVTSLAIQAASDDVTIETRKAIIPSEGSAVFSAESARIFLVAGCYSTQENAAGMVEYLKKSGFDPFILDRTPAGLYRVVYGSYVDITAATDELSTIRKAFNEEAWLLIL